MSNPSYELFQDAETSPTLRAGAVSPPFTTRDLYGTEGSLLYTPSEAQAHAEGYTAGVLMELADALDLQGQYSASRLTRAWASRHAVAVAEGTR